MCCYKVPVGKENSLFLYKENDTGCGTPMMSHAVNLIDISEATLVLGARVMVL
jgi:hypothetical protein